MPATYAEPDELPDWLIDAINRAYAVDPNLTPSKSAMTDWFRRQLPQNRFDECARLIRIANGHGKVIGAPA